jgi:hypothetical protein
MFRSYDHLQVVALRCVALDGNPEPDRSDISSNYQFPFQRNVVKLNRTQETEGSILVSMPLFCLSLWKGVSI